jgi:hypothetical protein
MTTNFRVEVCVDSVESVINTQSAGADFHYMGGNPGMPEFRKRIADTDRIKASLKSQI